MIIYFWEPTLICPGKCLVKPIFSQFWGARKGIECGGFFPNAIRCHLFMDSGGNRSSDSSYLKISQVKAPLFEFFCAYQY